MPSAAPRPRHFASQGQQAPTTAAIVTAAAMLVHGARAPCSRAIWRARSLPWRCATVFCTSPARPVQVDARPPTAPTVRNENEICRVLLPEIVASRVRATRPRPDAAAGPDAAAAYGARSVLALHAWLPAATATLAPPVV